MPSGPLQPRIDAERKNPVPCAAEGCRDFRRYPGRYCEKHDYRQKRYGSPLGTPLPRKVLERYRTASERFVMRNADHPAVQASLVRIGEWLSSAIQPHRLNKWSKPDQRLADWLARSREAGAQPEEILSTVFAVYAMLEDRPGDFHSDQHFWHMLGLYVLRIGPGAKVFSKKSGKPYAIKLSTKLCRHFGIILKQSFGYVATKAAAKILEDIKAKEPINSTPVAVSY